MARLETPPPVRGQTCHRLSGRNPLEFEVAAARAVDLPRLFGRARADVGRGEIGEIGPQQAVGHRLGRGGAAGGELDDRPRAWIAGRERRLSRKDQDRAQHAPGQPRGTEQRPTAPGSRATGRH